MCKMTNRLGIRMLLYWSITFTLRLAIRSRFTLQQAGYSKFSVYPAVSLVHRYIITLVHQLVFAAIGASLPNFAPNHIRLHQQEHYFCDRVIGANMAFCELQVSNLLSIYKQNVTFWRLTENREFKEWQFGSWKLIATLIPNIIIIENNKT